MIWVLSVSAAVPSVMPFSLASADNLCDSGVAAAIGAPTIGANRNFAVRGEPGAVGVPAWVDPDAVTVPAPGAVAGLPGVATPCAAVVAGVPGEAVVPGVAGVPGAGVVWLFCRSDLVTPIGDSELLHAVSASAVRTATAHVSELRDVIFSQTPS